MIVLIAMVGILLGLGISLRILAFALNGIDRKLRRVSQIVSS